MLQNHFLFPDNECLVWKRRFLYGFFNPNYKNTEFTFCINIFFLCCLLHDDNKKSVFTAKKKKHLNEMYAGLHRFSFMCKFSPLIVSHYKKSPNVECVTGISRTSILISVFSPRDDASNEFEPPKFIRYHFRTFFFDSTYI